MFHRAAALPPAGHTTAPDRPRVRAVSAEAMTRQDWDQPHEYIRNGTAKVLTLFHPADGRVRPIDEVAHSAGTVGYELMCALAPRVPVAEA